MRLKLMGHSMSGNSEIYSAEISRNDKTILLELFGQTKLPIDEAQWKTFFLSVVGATQVAWRVGSPTERQFIETIDHVRDTQAFQVALALVHLSGDSQNPIVQSDCKVSDVEFREQLLQRQLFKDRLPKNNRLLVFPENLQLRINADDKEQYLFNSGYLLKSEIDGLTQLYVRPYNTPMLPRYEITKRGLEDLLRELKEFVWKAFDMEGS